jgi:hypothetical protein
LGQAPAVLFRRRKSMSRLCKVCAQVNHKFWQYAGCDTVGSSDRLRLKRPAPRALCEFPLSFPASLSLAAVSFSPETNRSYLKNVRRIFGYSITSFSLRRCESASGSSTADERGVQAASLDSSSIFSSPDSISAAYTNVNSCRHFAVAVRDQNVRIGVCAN